MNFLNDREMLQTLLRMDEWLLREERHCKIVTGKKKKAFAVSDEFRFELLA